MAASRLLILLQINTYETPNKKVEPPFLSVDKTSVSTGPGRDTIVLNVTSNQNWKITVPDNAKSWLSITPDNGSGEAQIQLIINENAGNTARNTELKLEAVNSNADPVVLTVGQGVFGYKSGWSKGFGGTDNDYASQMIKVADGMVIIGSTASNDGDVNGNKGERDIWIIKTDHNGNVIWKTITGGNRGDVGISIAQTSDGGFMALGISASTDLVLNGTVSYGGNDLMVIKLNSMGQVQWQKTFGGSNQDYGQYITATPDGSCIITGSTYSINGDIDGNVRKGYDDMWVLKLAIDGSVIWNRIYGGNGSDAAFSAVALSDGNYMIAGNSYSADEDFSGAGHHGYYDIALLKLNALNGDLMSKKMIGGNGFDYMDYGQSFQATPTGFILAATTNSTDGDLAGTVAKGEDDIWVVKLKENGSIEWQTRMGGSKDDISYDITSTTTGYILAGYTQSNDGDIIGFNGYYDAWVAQLNNKGEKVWSKCYGTSGKDGFTSMVNMDNMVYFSGWVEGNIATGYHGGGDLWMGKLEAQ
jgi:hypothetical protein